LNVGQGDATVIATAQGQTLLVDAGNVGMGANRVGPALDNLHRSGLDYVIVTNYSPEHLNGLGEVLAPLGGIDAVKSEVLDPGGEANTPEFRKYKSLVGSKRRTMEPGESLVLGDLRIRCLAAGGRTVAGAPAQALRSEGDRSIVLALDCGEFSMLLGSDIQGVDGASGRDIESELAPALKPVDVFRSNRHASDESNRSRLLKVLSPTVALVSAGDRPDGQASESAVRRMLDAGSRVYLANAIPGSTLEPGRVKVVNTDIWLRVHKDFFTVHKDTFRYRPAVPAHSGG
jgi:beta-lactamase superfamily II metal-dependent hydrolase